MDISTAPKTGEMFIGYYKTRNGCIPVIVWWSEDDGRWETYGRKSPPITNWMPLPPLNGV